MRLNPALEAAIDEMVRTGRSRADTKVRPGKQARVISEFKDGKHIGFRVLYPGGKLGPPGSKKKLEKELAAALNQPGGTRQSATSPSKKEPLGTGKVFVTSYTRDRPTRRKK